MGMAEPAWFDLLIQTGFLVTLFTGPLVAVPSILCSLPGPPFVSQALGKHTCFLFGVLQHLPEEEGCEGNCFIVSNVVWRFSLAPGNSRP